LSRGTVKTGGFLGKGTVKVGIGTGRAIKSGMEAYRTRGREQAVEEKFYPSGEIKARTITTGPRVTPGPRMGLAGFGRSGMGPAGMALMPGSSGGVSPLGMMVLPGGMPTGGGLRPMGMDLSRLKKASMPIGQGPGQTTRPSLFGSMVQEDTSRVPPKLSKNQGLVWQALEAGSTSSDEIVQATGLGAGQVTRAYKALQKKGLAK